MMSIQEICQLIDEEDFDRAHEALIKLKREGGTEAILDYLLGCILDNYKNPRRSKIQAKKHFRLAIQHEKPVEDAFIKLSRLEERRSPHKIRILKRGLSIFPKSLRIHEGILGALEFDERENLFSQMVSEKLLSSYSVAIMMQTYLSLKNYKKVLDLVNTYWIEDGKEDLILSFIKAYCFLQIENVDKASKLFIKLIDSDITHSLNYAQYYGLVICHTKQSKLNLAIEVFDQIPFEEEIQSLYDPYFGPLDELYLECASLAITNLLSSKISQYMKAKARGLRALIANDLGFEPNLSRTKLLADLHFANKHIPSSKIFCLKLAEYALEDGDYLKTHDFTIQYLRNAWFDNESLEEVNYSYIHESCETTFEDIKDSLLNMLTNDGYKDIKVLSKGPCIPIIERLYQSKNYRDVVLIANAMSKELFETHDILFEAAYSFSENKKFPEAKRCYELYEKIFPGSSAAENNLGVLYENEGDLRKAKLLFKKALESDKSSELYKRNLKRLKSIEEAKEAILQSNLNLKRALLILWREKDIDDLLPNPIELLGKNLSKNGNDIEALVEELEASLAILRVKDGYHNYNTPTYRINFFLLEYMSAIEEEVERTVGVVSALEKVTPESLSFIGYDENLTLSLKRVASFEVQQQLQRDLREAAIALLSESYKTTMILSGSIIEAILLDKVTSKGIDTYEFSNGKSKATNRMDLADLLYVAEKELIIESNLYYLAQALRGFRNLIHPGVEQRLSAIKVTEQNARIAWDITRKLICDV